MVYSALDICGSRSAAIAQVVGPPEAPVPILARSARLTIPAGC